MSFESHDLLVIGGGAAGLRAAAAAGREVEDVAVVSKTHVLRSHSVAAQGGIAAPLGNARDGRDDSWESHFEDTVEGGDYLVDRDACRVLAESAGEIALELEHMGVPFNRTGEGKLDQRPFAGHSKPRALYAADRTGHAILYTLYGENLKLGTKFYNEYYVLDLLTEGDTVQGVVAYEVKSGQLTLLGAEAVILATGGCSQAYEVTSSGRASTGDGLGLALRNGIPVEDMEFIQFHPTGLKDRGSLVTEAARGEGGYLLNDDEDRFMKSYEPEALELAPRDAVVRAMQKEIDAGRGIDGEDYLYLDLTHLPRETLKSDLPTVTEMARDFKDVNPAEEPIPVQPTAHYCMGGIPTNTKGRVRTDAESGLWENLYAAGEAACVSVHGANRLGTNSLLEAVTFGKRAGKNAAARTESGGRVIEDEKLKGEYERKLNRLLEKEGSVRVPELRNELKTVMTEFCGVFREENGLKEAVRRIEELREKYRAEVYLEDEGKQFNTELRSALELENTLEYSEMVARAALAREESRGAHYRVDFPETDDENWLLHSFARKKPSEKKEISYRPVDQSSVR